MRKNALKGFTLIELLVVISIIALLLSILMPGLQKAKESAKTLVCKTHLKQLGVGLVTYSIDNDNKSLVTSEWNTATGSWDQRLWFLSIAPYMGEDRYSTDPGSLVEGAMEGGMAVMNCPASKGIDEEKEVSGSYYVHGGAKNRWRYHVYPVEGNYGINSWVAGMDFEMATTFGYIKEKQLTLSLRDGNTRGDTPAITDAAWVEVALAGS